MGTGAKGTKSNPYTMAEFEELADAGLWQGGYVIDDSGNVAYMMAEITVIGYSGYSGYGSSGSGSDGSWDPWGSDDGEGSRPWDDDDDDDDHGSHSHRPSGGPSEELGGGGGGHHNSGNNLISESKLGSLIRQASILSSKLANYLTSLHQNERIVRAVPTPEHKCGYYNKFDKKKYLTINTQSYNIWHELIHLRQDENNLLGKDSNEIHRSSNNEFQAYMIQNIADSMMGYFRESSFRDMGFSSSEAEELHNLVYDHCDGFNKPFWIGQEVIDYLNNGNKERWVNNFIHYWEQQETHPIGYTKPYYPNYDWRWEDYFEFLGIEIR